MNHGQQVQHILNKREEQSEHHKALLYLDKLKSHIPDKIFRHIVAVINSQYAQCERSIRDHEKEIAKNLNNTLDA